jgi:hypothetical protein
MYEEHASPYTAIEESQLWPLKRIYCFHYHNYRNVSLLTNMTRRLRIVTIDNTVGATSCPETALPSEAPESIPIC